MSTLTTTKKQYHKHNPKYPATIYNKSLIMETIETYATFIIEYWNGINHRLYYDRLDPEIQYIKLKLYYWDKHPQPWILTKQIEYEYSIEHLTEEETIDFLTRYTDELTKEQINYIITNKTKYKSDQK